MAEFNHSDRAHARLSASGAKRWLACTPSVRMEDDYKDRTSEAAEEGTAAHELAEHIIRHHVDASWSLQERSKDWERVTSSKYYNAEMQEYINEFARFVVGEYMQALGKTRTYPDPYRARIELETRLDLSRYVPESFGTGDILITVPGDEVIIIDLKYGKGVPVSAENNEQLRLYALGVLTRYESAYSFPNVRMIISQPRLNSLTQDVMSTADLIAWGTDYVKPRAIMAFEGRGEFVPGDHCTFCKARRTCAARAEKNMELVPLVHQDPRHLSLGQISDILHRVDEFKSWASDLESYAFDESLKGTKIPGWKLVEGRGRRVISDPDLLAFKLEFEKGLPSSQIYKAPTLLGITELEKLTGKKWFRENTDDIIAVKPPAPTLVPDSDIRNAIDSTVSIADMFTVIPPERGEFG